MVKKDRISIIEWKKKKKSEKKSENKIVKILGKSKS